LPLLALAGRFYAIICTEDILHEKSGMVQTIVRFLRFLLKILQDVFYDHRGKLYPEPKETLKELEAKLKEACEKLY
jgi:hypothetical protein